MPPPLVSWMTPNSQRQSGYMLELTSINKSQAGEYKCEASNECGNATRTASIHVQFKLPGTRILISLPLQLSVHSFIPSQQICIANQPFLPCSSRLTIFLPFSDSSMCDGTLVCCYWYAMARSYWFISILIIILTIRCCSLIGPLCNRSVVMLFDQKHRCFRNFDFVVSIDVIRMNSYVDGFFNLTCVTLRIIINKF